MKDNQNINAAGTAESAEAEEVKAAAVPAKFKDVEALLSAYQALEAEFTRRSQRLKELEANKETQAPARAAVSAEAPSHGGAESVGEKAVSALTDEVKNAVIEEYLNGIFAKRAVPFVTGGGAVAAERRTPKTLKEAGALANRLFENKEDK